MTRYDASLLKIKNKYMVLNFLHWVGSSDMSMSSLRTEEGICKKLISQGISLKNGTLYCIRWTYNKKLIYIHYVNVYRVRIVINI